MKLTLTPTDRITTIDGNPCRVWEGTTDRGTSVFAYIVALAVPAEQWLSGMGLRPPPIEEEMGELLEIMGVEDPELTTNVQIGIIPGTEFRG
jgi:hypothetical protein